MAEPKTNAMDLEMADTAETMSSETTTAETKASDALSSETDGKQLDKATGSTSSVFRRGGIFPTAICLSKAAIGAGVLSVSVHAAEVGAVYQFICLLLGGFLTIVSIRMISIASIETQRWSFEDVCEELFHPAMSLFTGFINACVCLGSAAGYLIVCGQVFVVIFDADDRARNLFVVSVGILVCCPLALARHVGFMRHLAAMSVGALVLLVITVGWYLGLNGLDESVTAENFLFGPGAATVFTYMNSINNLVFAYNNQFNVPQLTGELTPVPSTRDMTKVSVLSTGMSFILYSSVSILGVLAFGVAEGQKDSLILDLFPVRKEAHVVLSLLAVLFSVLTCFQFHIFPVRQFLAFNVRKLRGRSADGETTDVIGLCGRSMTRWYDIIGALGSVALVILIAVVITSLRAMLDFVGAFGAAYISYVVPPLWIIALRRKATGSKFSWFTAEMLLCLAFLGLGLFLFVFGTYAATVPLLQGAWEPFQSLRMQWRLITWWRTFLQIVFAQCELYSVPHGIWTDDVASPLRETHATCQRLNKAPLATSSWRRMRLNSHLLNLRMQGRSLMRGETSWHNFSKALTSKADQEAYEKARLSQNERWVE